MVNPVWNSHGCGVDASSQLSLSNLHKYPKYLDDDGVKLFHAT
jgi:hypothetical protein